MQETLDRVRARLSDLVALRYEVGLTEAQQSEYDNLAVLEVLLLADQHAVA